jgi:hypothetical protein
MSRSIDVAKVMPLKLVSISCISGIGKSSLWNLELKTLKLETILTTLFLFGMMKDRDCYLQLPGVSKLPSDTGFILPIFVRLCIS